MKIELYGTHNTRDLGGIETLDGKTIAFHRLVRSDDLSKLNFDDTKKLFNHGVRKVIDFRTADEMNSAPDVEISGVTYVKNPIFDGSLFGITKERKNDLIGLIADSAEIIRKNNLTATEYMQNMYRKFVETEFSRKQYAKFFDELLSTNDGAVLWHCSAGKDRAGIGAALLLFALGVDMESILDDYMATLPNMLERIDEIVEKLAELIDDKKLLEAVRQTLLVDKSFLLAFFDEVEQKYNGVQNFLQQELLLTEKKIEKLKEKFLI